MFQSRPRRDSNTETTQYECETYTWSVLPEADRPTDDAALARGIAREVASARDALGRRRSSSSTSSGSRPLRSVPTLRLSPRLRATDL